MTDLDEHVYPDLDKRRLTVASLAALTILAVVAGVALRQLSGSNDADSATGVTAETGSEAQPTTSIVDPQADATKAVEDFADALSRQNLSNLEFAFGDGIEADEELATLTNKVGSVEIDPKPGTIQLLDNSTASAPFQTNWTLEDGAEFTTEGTIEVRRVGSVWLVDWELAILESSLDPGDVLVQERAVAQRAPIVGARDETLVGDRPAVQVGVIPRRSDDIATLAELLGETLGIEPGEIEAAIAPSPSDSVVPITTVSPVEAEAIAQRMAAYQAVVFETTTLTQAIDPRFARALLGRTGEVTAEIIEEHPELFVAGDIVGRSGLQREYNAQLAGRPGLQIRVERRFPSPTVPVAGQPDPDVIYLDPAVQGVPLRLTIDARIQRAAEDALIATDLNSAIVAIQPSTGHVLAVANGPGAAVNNFALTGRYPPGSIFKTITAYAAMAQGASSEESLDCPFDLEVDGRRFSNAEGEVLGTVPLRQAYVLSCNTAFINLANRFLDRSDFASYAAAFGVGVPYDLGTAASSGNVPNPGNSVDFAATSFGQAQILFSPLSGAVMAATAAAGVYRPPVLVLEAPDDLASTEATAAEEPIGQPLDPVIAGQLQQMMREVVTNGTGRAVANVAGGPVSGKTGTAEFGSGDPPPAHAWFVGFQGDLAFAVFVEGGEFGGSTAGPIAGDFLNRLAG